MYTLHQLPGGVCVALYNLLDPNNWDALFTVQLCHQIYIRFGSPGSVLHSWDCWLFLHLSACVPIHGCSKVMIPIVACASMPVLCRYCVLASTSQEYNLPEIVMFIVWFRCRCHNFGSLHYQVYMQYSSKRLKWPVGTAPWLEQNWYTVFVLADGGSACVTA